MATTSNAASVHGGKQSSAAAAPSQNTDDAKEIAFLMDGSQTDLFELLFTQNSSKFKSELFAIYPIV